MDAEEVKGKGERSEVIGLVCADVKLHCSCGLQVDANQRKSFRNAFPRRGCTPFGVLTAGSALQRRNIEIALKGPRPCGPPPMEVSPLFGPASGVS